jgi:adenylosuccinate lyase
VELRHLQRTEVSEVREGFKTGQKGSSAMPHKRNPISAETLTGLSRVLRGNLQTGLQNVALWHERDISHSSAERIVLPDSSLLAYYVVRRLTTLLIDLEVDSVRMQRNLDSSFGVVFSQPVLLALVNCGMSRDEAYRIVQQDTARASEIQVSFRQVLEDDNRVKLSDTQLDNAFDAQRAIHHASRSIDALDAIRS